MKSREIKGVLALASMLWSVCAGAVPVKYPACAKFVTKVDVPGGQGSFFNQDCTAIYVLPPTRGAMTVNGYVPSANLSVQCDRLRKIEEDSNNLEDISASTTRRLKKLAAELEEIETNLEAGLVPVGQTRESLEKRMDELMEKMTKLRTELVTWQGQNDTKKVNFAKVEGGRGKFVVESAMTKLLQDYKTANPRLNVLAMPVDQAFLSINEVKADETANSSAMPAVLSLTAVGISRVPMLRDPSLMLQFKEFVPGQAPDGAKLFGGALPGQLQVSNIGACALQKSIGSTPAFSMGDVKSYIAAASTFSYQVQVERKHKITIKFRELISQLHEQSKKGGFFSTETLNKFIDERQTGTWVEFDVDSNDGRFEYSDQYVREVKKEAMDAAIAQIVAVQTGSPTAMLALIETGKNGAGTIGDELQKCPHLYCQIGAAGMKVLDSIFGSSSAVSHLLKTVQAERIEKVAEKKMVPAFGTTTFE